MARVLVTGGTGLIGFHLIKALEARGERVRVLHRATSNLNLLRGLRIEPVVGDLGEPERLALAVRGCQRVYHLAAHVSMSRRDATAMQTINVDGTRTLVESAEREGVERFVNVSSIAAMGVAKQGAATEEEPYNHHPGRPYMETKHQAEEIAHASSGAMTLMSVRPSLVVGPGPFRRGMVAAFIERALHSGIPLAPSGGINIVDVEDVVAVLMEAMNEGRDGERFLATGHNLTTRNLMERICGLAEKPGPAVTLPAWITGAASRAMDFWMGLGLPGELPALPMRMAGTHLYYDDSWTRSRLNLEAPKPLEHTLLRRIEWERNQR